MRGYAGQDPVFGKRQTLVEVIPPGPRAAARAEATRTRLLAQVDEHRNPRTSALDKLLDRHLEPLEVGRTTHWMYTRYLEKHVRLRPTAGARSRAEGLAGLARLHELIGEDGG